MTNAISGPQPPPDGIAASGPRRRALRLAVGAGTVAVVVGALVAGPAALLVAGAPLLVAAYAELARLLGGRLGAVTVIGGAGTVCFAVVGTYGRPSDLPWVATGLLVAAFAARILLVETGISGAQGTVGELTVAIGASAAVGLLGAHVMFVRSSAQLGLQASLVLVAMTAASCTAAYLASGGPRRLPGFHVDRRETWIATGAAVGSGVVIGAVAASFLQSPFDLGASMALGLAIGLVAPVGPMACSVLRAGQADESSASPPEGGPLSLVSGVLLSAPLFYWAFWMLVA